MTGAQLFLGHDMQFWVALLLATMVRVVTSPFHNLWRSVVMVVTSVFVAWVFTDPVVDWMHLDPVIYKAPVGALLALTADGLVRIALNAAADPAQFLRMWRRLRGQEGDE
jgi:hypothetical protein